MKKFLVIALTIVLAIGVTACSGEKDISSSSPSSDAINKSPQSSLVMEPDSKASSALAEESKVPDESELDEDEPSTDGQTAENILSMPLYPIADPAEGEYTIQSLLVDSGLARENIASFLIADTTGGDTKWVTDAAQLDELWTLLGISNLVKLEQANSTSDIALEINLELADGNRVQMIFDGNVSVNGEGQYQLKDASNEALYSEFYGKLS